MRKLVVIVFLCIGIVLSIKEVFLKKDNVRNSLLLYNIEALAADNEFPGAWSCNFAGSIDCPGTHIKVKYVYEGYSLEY